MNVMDSIEAKLIEFFETEDDSLETALAEGVATEEDIESSGLVSGIDGSRIEFVDPRRGWVSAPRNDEIDGFFPRAQMIDWDTPPDFWR